MAIDKLFGKESDCGGCGPVPAAINPPATTNAQWYIKDNIWWLGNYNSGVPANGVPGPRGLTPYIGSNDNWWIGAEDTGVPATGNTTVDMPEPESATNLFD